MTRDDKLIRQFLEGELDYKMTYGKIDRILGNFGYANPKNEEQHNRFYREGCQYIDIYVAHKKSGKHDVVFGSVKNARKILIQEGLTDE